MSAAPLASTPSIDIDAPRTHNRLHWAIVDTLTMTRRHLLHIPQAPEQLFSATFQPIMMVLLFRYVFGGAIATPGMSYVNFLMPGIFLQSVVMEGMTGGINLALDFKQGIIEAFCHGTIRKPQTTFGNVKADVLARLDPNYRRVDFCDVILNAAWAE